MSHTVLEQAKTDLGYAERQLECHRKKLMEAEKELELAHDRIKHWEAAVDRALRIRRAIETVIEESPPMNPAHAALTPAETFTHTGTPNNKPGAANPSTNSQKEQQ